jgi:CBS domain-containing protein
MSREVITCSPDTDLARVGWLMWEGDCGALPVLLGGEVVGMITDRDLAMAASMKPRPCVELHVSEAMSLGDVALVRPDATIEEALDVMCRSRVRRLPVVDSGGRLTGILSIGDVLRHSAGSPQHLLQALGLLCEPRMRATI